MALPKTRTSSLHGPSPRPNGEVTFRVRAETGALGPRVDRTVTLDVDRTGVTVDLFGAPVHHVEWLPYQTVTQDETGKSSTHSQWGDSQ